MAIRVDTAFQAVYIHEPEGHTVPALNTPWTVAGLYRLEADVNLDTLIVALYGTTAAGSWVGLYMNADGVSCRLEGWNGTGSPTVSSNYTLEVGRDYRLAIDYNGSGTVRMLLDGVAVLTLSFTPVAGTAGERSLQWGGYGELAGYTSCTLARWRMWTAVLAEAEHRAEYRSLIPVKTSGLIHDWPMNPGSARFDDTVAGEPDLSENPAVPVGDGTAFVLRASVLGTPQFFDLGSTATPGAQTITVPQYAERVAIFFHLSDDASTPDSTLSSLTSNFAGTFTLTRATASSVAMGVAVATASVTTTGSGRTFTPVFSAVNTVAGAGCWVVFLQDVGSSFPTGAAVAQATGVGTTAGTASASGAINGLAIAVDTRLDAATSNYPANQSGWASIATEQETGPFTYWACSRIRTKDITANGTESATTQNPNGSCVAILTVPSAVPAGYSLQVTPGSYTLTGSSARTLATRKALVTPGSYALTGSSTRTLYRRLVAVSPGAYSITGSTGTLLRSYPLSVSPGSYSVTGADGSLIADRLVGVTPGSYAVTGSDVELVYTPVTPSPEIVVTPGSYSVVGADASLVRSLLMSVTPGSYSLTGANAGLPVGRLVEVDPGSYALTGSSGSLTAARSVAVVSGEYQVTGSDVSLDYESKNKELIVLPGHYDLTGYAANLAYDGSSNLTQAAPGLTPKVWPGLWVRYEGRPKKRIEDLEEEERERIEEAAERAVIHAANERTKKAMRDSLQASMRAAEIELAAKSYLRLVEQAALLRMEQIEEEDIAVTLLLM